MPLSNYAELQASILSWLARPGDPLVSPAVPDIIQLFESEATRRLKVGGAEKHATLTTLSSAAALPADFGELRLATVSGVVLGYVTPMQLPSGDGVASHYTIIGNDLYLGPAPSGGSTIDIVYQSGVPPLSDSNPSNWLLTQHPDCYLFGSLVEAESFIGSDERVPLWAQRREAAFASIESADRKARWGGAPLSIRAEGVAGGNGIAAGGSTSAPVVSIPISIANGGTGSTTAAAALTALGAAPLASPVFTGNPTAPTPATADSDTSIATTAYVQAQGYATSAAMSTADNLRVLKAGDTMTGPLTIASTGGWSTLALDSAAATGNTLRGQRGGSLRWDIYLGDTIAEGGSNAGSNFTITRYSDAGASLGNALSINRATGDAVFSGTVNVNANVAALNYVIGSQATNVVGTVGFTNTNGPAISFNGTGSAGAGALGFAVSGTSTMFIDPTNFALKFISTAGGLMPNVDNNCYCGSPSLAFFQNNSHNYATISDPAQKTDIEPVPEGMLAQVMAIEPYSYRWKTEDPGNPKHWGFMAPDVAAAMGPDFAGVMHDKESGVFTLSYNDLTAVLWQAVRELAAELVALKAKP